MTIHLGDEAILELNEVLLPSDWNEQVSSLNDILCRPHASGYLKTGLYSTQPATHDHVLARMGEDATDALSCTNTELWIRDFEFFKMYQHFMHRKEQRPVSQELSQNPRVSRKERADAVKSNGVRDRGPKSTISQGDVTIFLLFTMKVIELLYVDFQVNPSGRIPAVVHCRPDGTNFAIFESSILLYLTNLHYKDCMFTSDPGLGR